MPEIPNHPQKPNQAALRQGVPPRRQPSTGTPIRQQPPGPGQRPPVRRQPPAPGQATPVRQQTASGQIPGRTPAAGRRVPNPQTPARRAAASGRGVPPRKAPPSGQGNPPRRRPPQHRKNYGPNFPLILAIVLLILGTIIMIVLSLNLAGGEEEAVRPTQGQKVELFEKDPAEQTEKPPLPGKETEPAETQTDPNQVVASAKFVATGDLLIHKSIINGTSAVNQGDKGYNFDSIFKFLGGYTDTADYAVANLETTLFGPGKPYSGNPEFNTPDDLVDSAKKAGFDMLLTANNHCNDTGLDGILRTLKVIREKGLQTLGTNLTEEEDKYVIQDVNGIKIGMLCYTYEDSRDPNQVTFNYHGLPAKGKNLVCAFPKFQDAKSREPFYTGLEAQIAEMREKGAEAIVLFVHWGEEYQLGASRDQKDMAQKFCDMGVDLIVGGHPHVVQPIELLTSNSDPEHKTVCLYSMGNAVSNQRKEEMTKSCPTGHTEDGMLFGFTFQKYADGTVRLAEINVIPTWVDMHNNADGKREYNILPLEDARREEWPTLFGLDAGRNGLLSDSYKRTMDIVGPGLEASNQYLSGADVIPADAS